MEELKVPTRPLAVELFLADGGGGPGTMFLTDTPLHLDGPEDIFGVLNDERGFLPFESAAMGSSLINKRHILRVCVPDMSVDDLRPTEIDEANRAPACTLQLIDGSRVRGRPVIETPGSASRLVDKLNQAAGFITFIGDRGVDYVQRSHITRIFLLD